MSGCNCLKAIRLEIQNFRSVGELVTIDFTALPSMCLIKGTNYEIAEIEVAGGGGESSSTIIRANNGSGKSTIIDGILFSLYGRTLNQADNRQLINRTIGNKLKTFCRFVFEINGKLYDIEAFLNVKGKANPTVGFKVKIDGGEPLERNTPQMKEMIEEQIIGCPFDLFKSSVVISQNSYVDFYSMTKSQKISYIEQLFKLTVFGEWLKNTRADLNVAKSEYNITNSKISQLGNTIFDLQTKSDLYDEQQKTKKSKIELYLFNKLAELDEAKKNLGALKPQSDIKNSEFALSVCVEKLSAKTELFRKLSSAIAELTASKTAIIESMNKHKQILDVLCEDCLGKSEELIDMPTMRGKLQDCSEKLERLTGAFNQIKTDIDALKSEELDLRNKIREYGQMQTSYERQQRNIEFFEKECASIREEIEKDCNSENPFGELLEKNKSQLETLKAELSEKYKRISMLSVAEMTFNDSGAKKLIFVDLVKKINELLSYYLARMGASYRVIFSPDFDFEFMTESGPSDFSLFSSGEQQRICLSTMFTFRDLVVGNRISSDFFILDEVLDVGIDENCVHRVCDSIKSLMESMSVKTMIISHNKTVIDKIQSFDNVGTISAIKKDGQTKYEVELP